MRRQDPDTVAHLPAASGGGPQKPDITWTVIGLLVGALVAGLSFILIGLGKVDRSELRQESDRIQAILNNQVEKLERSDELTREQIAALNARLEDLEATVIRNTARIDFLMQGTGIGTQPVGGTQPGGTQP